MGKLISVFIGCLFGIFTGLAPGVHLNTFIPLFFLLEPNFVPGFAVGTIVSDSFFNFIPTIFLGVPEESSAMALLPGHRLALKGKGLKAFKASVIGGVSASLIVLILLPATSILTGFYDDIQALIPFFVISLVLLLSFSSEKKFKSFLAVLVSGLIGVIALDQFSSSHAFLCMFSGFFAVSAVFFMIKNRTKLPKQEEAGKTDIGFRPVLFGGLGGLFAGVLPGVTSSVVGVATKKFCGIRRALDKMVVIGGTNTVYAFVSVLAIFLIGRPRSGAAIAVRNYYSQNFFHLTGLVLLALGLSAFLALSLGPRFAAVFSKYSKLNYLAVGLVLVIVSWFAGLRGILLLFVCSLLGIGCVFSRVRRSCCMGSILIPLLLYYF